MKNIACTKRCSAILFLLLLAALYTTAGAHEFERGGRFELYGTYQHMNGDTITPYAFGSAVKFDNSSLYGLGFGFNFTDNFNLNTDFLFGTSDAEINTFWGPATVDTELTLWNVNLDYNILKERLSPFISGGIGLFNTHADVWFDSIDDTDFSYNIGAGIRWDATDNLFIKAKYRWTYIEFDHSDDTPRFEGLSISIGWMF